MIESMCAYEREREREKGVCVNVCVIVRIFFLSCLFICRIDSLTSLSIVLSSIQIYDSSSGVNLS